MGRSEPRLSLSQIAFAEAFKHDQMLLRAMYKMQTVIYKEKFYTIRHMSTGAAGGGVETFIYLSGKTEFVPASEIALAPEIT